MSINETLDAIVREQTRRQGAWIDARIREHLIAGETEFDLVLPWNGGTLRCTLPSWRRHPIQRLKVESIRRKARRA